MRWLPWILLALAAGALLSVALPWMSCDVCVNAPLPVARGVETDAVKCPFCRDRRRVTAARGWLAPRLPPALAALLKASEAAERARLSLLEANGIALKGLPLAGIKADFFETSAGWRCVLIGGQEEDPVKAPMSLTRVFLFDDHARLLDHWEFRPREAARFAIVHPEGAAALRVGVLTMEPLPPSPFDLVIEGTSTAHEYGTRIDLSSGRLRIAP